MEKIFFLLVCSIAILSCQTTEPDHDIKFNIVVEDLVNNYNLPDDGYYYEYQFKDFRENIENIEGVLREYVYSGVSLQDAWYKSGSSSCHPPKSEYVLEVVVTPVFIIRTKFPSSFLLANNFEQVAKPKSFFCGYSVRHFIL